ncbi:hypothetical protein BDZ91DRAFT_711084 [Kalaharituber pfeilii]|nr:hypothetical protein BDZ91DRAFT_711084 [Kalaharituber pfeilii]
MSASPSTVIPAISVAVIGATGLTGSHLVRQLLHNDRVSRVIALARREPPFPIDDPHGKLSWQVEKDTGKWDELVRGVVGPSAGAGAQGGATTFISALGTTKADAGGVEKQREIDYELNLRMARAAREGRGTGAGADTYVLVSAAAVSPDSPFPYAKMKGELERDVMALGFEKTAFLKPGLIVGEREKSRMMEGIVQWAERTVRGVFGKRATEGWAQTAEEIARAAGRVGAEGELWGAEGRGWKAKAGEDGKKVWLVGQREIVGLAKGE